MKYRELYDDYTSLLQDYSKMRFELAALPTGGIVKKRITGKEYWYLQYTKFGKKHTKYLRKQEVDQVRTELSRAGQLRKKITQIDTRLEQLEQAAQILDAQMSRSFFFRRQCADMDALPLSKRPEALAFANAMTALEGLPVSKELDCKLGAWASGKIKYEEVYLPLLHRHHVLEDDYV